LVCENPNEENNKLRIKIAFKEILGIEAVQMPKT